MANASSSLPGGLRADERADTLASRRPAPRGTHPDAGGRKPPAGAHLCTQRCQEPPKMARLPRRMRPFITRSEIITGLVFMIVIAWLAMVALGMGV